MDETPLLRWKGNTVRIENTSCGVLAMDNHATAFWQSRETLAGRWVPPPRLTDLPALAQAVRASFRKPQESPSC